MSGGISEYRNNTVLSATPQELLLMLYDRLALDLEKAVEAIGHDDVEATYRVGHAGEIIAALAGSLHRDIWDGADGLFSLYMYLSSALIRVNLFRDQALLRECVGLVDTLRQAWHGAAGLLATPAAWETGDSPDGTRIVAIA